MPPRYLIARFSQNLRMSVGDAGKDKQPNRQLVYGGGSLAALALDVALRERSGDELGLPEFMRRCMRNSAGRARPTGCRTWSASPGA